MRKQSSSQTNVVSKTNSPMSKMASNNSNSTEKLINLVDKFQFQKQTSVDQTIFLDYILNHNQDFNFHNKPPRSHSHQAEPRSVQNPGSLPAVSSPTAASPSKSVRAVNYDHDAKEYRRRLQNVQSTLS